MSGNARSELGVKRVQPSSHTWYLDRSIYLRGPGGPNWVFERDKCGKMALFGERERETGNCV